MLHNTTVTTMHFKDKCSAAMAIGLLAMFTLNHAEASEVETAVDPITQLETTTYTQMKNVRSGELLFKTDQPGKYQMAITQKTAVDIDVNGMVANVTVKQHFLNESTDWVEGVYVFPLPESAAVNFMRIHIGERVIEGQIHERKQAQKIYKQAKAAGKRTGLVEQERSNMFTTSVANIAPGENIVVEIKYLETVRYDGGQFNLRFPSAITPRYIPPQPLAVEDTIQLTGGSGWGKGTAQVPDAARITPPLAQASHAETSSTNLNPITLNATIDTGFTLSNVVSPYHSVSVANDGTDYEVSLVAGMMSATRDFELVWTPEVGNAPGAAIFSESNGADNYALMMLLPPQHVNALELPREAIYVVDTSGSMDGESIVQARQALLLSLERLQPHDRFNVIEFNSYTDQLFAASELATAANIALAKQWVGQLDASGGTEMLKAVDAALGTPEVNGFVRQVLFMTDGSIGDEDALFSAIEQDLGLARLFTVGIGSAPNSHFMKKAAQFGRGTYTYIGSAHEIASKMQKLFSKLESPVLTNLHIDWPENAQVEMYPNRLPDLYLGEPVLVSLKTDLLAGEVKMSGDIAGQAWQQNMQLSLGAQNAGIGTLWAREKIESLSDRMLSEGATNELSQAIVDVALAHSLVSKYTSFVAVDTTVARPADEGLKQEALQGNLPQGQRASSYPQAFSQTATAMPLHFLVGCLSLLMTLLLQFKTQLVQRIKRLIVA